MKKLPAIRKKTEKETVDAGENIVIMSVGEAREETAAEGFAEKLLTNRLFLGILASLTVLVLALVCVPHNTSVSLTEFVTVETVGLDGYGKAFAGADETAIYKELRERLGIGEEESGELRERIHTAVEGLTLSETEGLSNGDTISLCVEDDSRSLEAYWLNIHGRPRDFSISGLPGPFSVRLADYLTAQAQGVDGYGELIWQLDEAKLKKDIETQVEPEGWKAVTAAEWADAAVKELKQKIVLTAENEGAIKIGDGTSAAASVEGNVLDCGIKIEAGKVEVDTGTLVQGITLVVSDCIAVREEGFSGIGTVQPYLDEALLKEKVAELLVQAGREEETETVCEAVLAQLKTDLSLEADKSEGLSNRETVTVTVGGEDPLALAASCGVVLEYGSHSFTIGALTEPKEQVLTDLITVTFEGICPNLEMKVEPKEDYRDCISEISLASGPLRAQRGDELLLTASVDPEKALAAGVIVPETEETVTVLADTYQYNPQEAEEVLWEKYVTEHFTEAFEAIWEKKEIEAQTGAVRWDKSSLYPDRLLVMSLEKDSDAENRVFMIYKGSLRTGGVMFGSKTEVYYVRMEDNLLLKADGSMEDTGNPILVKHASGVLYSEEELNQYLEKQQSEMTRFSDAQTVRMELDLSKRGTAWFEENRQSLTEEKTEEEP